MEILNRHDGMSFHTRGFLGVGVTLLWMLGALCATAPQSRAADSYSEDAVKAAYLYRFVGYVG